MAGPFDLALPTGKPVVNRDDQRLSLSWNAWFDRLVLAIGAMQQFGPSAPYDPGSLASGASVTVSMDTPGTVAGDFALASFSTAIAGITVKADVVTADKTAITITNQTGGAVDLPSGEFRVHRIKAL